MAKKIDNKQEEIENESRETVGSGIESGSTSTGGDGEGQLTGQGIGETGTETGNPVQASGRAKGRPRKNRDGAKASILSNIRDKTNKGNSGVTNEEHGSSQSELPRASGDNGRADGGDENNTGTQSGTGLGTGIDNGQAPRSDGSNDNNRPSDETNRGVKKGGGVEVKSIDFTKLPSAKAQKPLEQKDVKWEEALTKKEATELKPRIEEALTVAFGYADKGIGATTKNPSARTVFIWSSISKEEIGVIALSLIESGQRSKVIATATRRIARDYTKFQLGIILLPRFYMTVQHYLTEGFAFGLGGKQS